MSVCKFPGCVFTSCPESCYVNRDGLVVDFTFSLWKSTILNPLKGKFSPKRVYIECEFRLNSHAGVVVKYTLHFIFFGSSFRVDNKSDLMCFPRPLHVTTLTPSITLTWKFDENIFR